MAHQFIGLHMLVILREPPARLKGTVSDIEAGISLTLSNGPYRAISPKIRATRPSSTWTDLYSASLAPRHRRMATATAH
jgi:hypothetical protein